MFDKRKVPAHSDMHLGKWRPKRIIGDEILGVTVNLTQQHGTDNQINFDDLPLKHADVYEYPTISTFISTFIDGFPSPRLSIGSTCTAMTGKPQVGSSTASGHFGWSPFPHVGLGACMVQCPWMSLLGMREVE